MEQQDLMKINVLGQEAEKLEQQIQVIEQQAKELVEIRQSIEEISSNKNKEILSNLGKGIFIETQVKKSELMINIGSNVLVKKTPAEALEIIDTQLKQLSEGKGDLAEKVEELQENMQKLFLEMQKSERKKSDKHKCDDEDCECENDCGDDCECERNK
jgi:prefoldin alpha subunit